MSEMRIQSTTDHKFPWKWRLSDLEDVPKNGKTVFSCFSHVAAVPLWGYKLAGYKVVGNCEIDEAMIKVYRKNHHPQVFLSDGYQGFQ